MSPATVATVVGLVLACARIAAAQDLRVTVRSAETLEPVPFSIVALIPAYGQRFTDQRGEYLFSGLVPGSYRLLVRQIGYLQLDTMVAVRAEGTVNVSVALRRLAIELPPVTVAERATCVRPGLPDRALNPALAAVFDELLENARRFELLADSYPFRFRFERAFRGASREGDSLAPEVDTLDLASGEMGRPYRPGKVVDQGTGPFRNSQVISLLALREFADSAFLGNHCFRLAGRDTVEGERLVRLDFEPDARLRSTDLEGAAYLDTLTYQIRYTRVSLTRPGRELRGVVGLTATTRFSAVVPGIVLHDHVRAVMTFRPPPRHSREAAARVETQRRLRVEFVRPLIPAP